MVQNIYIKMFPHFLNNLGISFIQAIPGHPQQNGLPEWLNQTINNCTKALFPLFNVLHFLYNSNPYSSINFKIPNELLFFISLC